MDGVRARRQKSGSPVGRLVDEAFDMITMLCYALWVGYGIQPNNRVLELIFFGAPIMAYCFEMRFIIARSLIMIVGELGPVELEIMIALGIAGIGYKTPEFWQVKVSESYTSLQENSFAESITWGHIAGCCTLPLLAIFSWENLGECVALDWF